MILEGDYYTEWFNRLRWGMCPKCETMLPKFKRGLSFYHVEGDRLVCNVCKLSIAVTPCDQCDDGMVREPDGYGCVQWTSCYRCDGKGWH